MSSHGDIRKRQDNDGKADFSDKGTSPNEIDEIIKRKKLQNKIRCQRYRNNKKKMVTIVSSQIYKHQTITDKEEEQIECHKENDKQTRQQNKIKKRDSNLIHLHTGQSSKTDLCNVSKCQHFHNAQYAGPSIKNEPDVSPIHTYDQSTQNEPYITETHSDYDVNIHNDTPSQVNYVPRLHKLIKTIYIPNNEYILPHDVPNNTQSKMSSAGGKRKRQNNFKGMVFSDDDMSQNEIDDIKNKRKNIQNTIRCQQYRNNKKKNDAMVSSQIYKHQTITVEKEEQIKDHKDYVKKKSSQYRKKKGSTNLITLHTDQSSKTVVRHVSKSRNFHNTQIEGPSTRNVQYVPPIHTNDQSTWNKKYMPESHSDLNDNIHNDTPTQVNYVPQLHESKITINVPNNEYILPHDVPNNTQLKCHKEHDKQKSQQYRDKKIAPNLINLNTDQSSKTDLKKNSKCQHFHNAQFADPSIKNEPYDPPIHTYELPTLNEPYIPESHSDYDVNIHNDTPLLVNYVPQLLEPIITIHVPNILPHDAQNDTKLNMSSEGGKRLTQDNDNGEYLSDDSESHNEIDEIKKEKKRIQNQIRCQRYRYNKKKTNAILTSQANYVPQSLEPIDEIKIEKRKVQNKIRCQRYRLNKKKTDAILRSRNKHRQITVEEEEKIKRRNEYNRQKSQRYRDKKKASNTINSHTDESSKTAVRLVSEC